MEKIKKYSNWIIIGLIALFIFTSIQKCSVNRKVKKLDNVVLVKDSIIQTLGDSIKVLNNEIRVLQTEKNGYTKSLEIQNEALNQISEAKKNINVTVKRN